MLTEFKNHTTAYWKLSSAFESEFNTVQLNMTWPLPHHLSRQSNSKATLPVCLPACLTFWMQTPCLAILF